MANRGPLRARMCLVFLAVISGLSAAARSSYAQQQELLWQCQVTYELVNYGRTVGGAPNTECHWPHSVPFGNWGVVSNGGSQVDGHQFDGWCRSNWVLYPDGFQRQCSNTWYEWHSCYNFAPPPNCNFYNTPSCTSQQTTQGENVHGGGFIAEFFVPEPSEGYTQGGCRALQGQAFTTWNNWMSLYELDLNDWDDFVQTLHFPPTTATLSCGSASECQGESAWTNYSSRNPYWTPDARALLKLRVRGDLVPIWWPPY